MKVITKERWSENLFRNRVEKGYNQSQEEGGELVGVMGIQHVRDVTLISGTPTSARPNETGA